MPESPRRVNWKWVVIAAFVLSRVVLGFFETPGSTMASVTLVYAFEMERAPMLGLSLYDMHAQNMAQGDRPTTPVERLVEYPPLSLLWMAVPGWLVDPIPKYGYVPEKLAENAKVAGRIVGIVVDFCGFALLALMGASAARLAFYTAGGLLLFPFLIDRFDLVLGVMLLVAVWLLVRKGPIWAPLAMLALAVNFKVTPLVLVPLFVLGTLPADTFQPENARKLFGAILRRTLLLAAFGVAMFAPFFARDGFATLDFLKYHAARGLEIESVWGTIPMVLAGIFQQPCVVPYHFGSVELESSLTPALVRLASLATIAVIPALAIAAWLLLRRRANSPETAAGATLAQAHPMLFLRCTLASVLSAMIVAKVLSPQYLLWILPLAALWRGRRIWWTCGVFCLICALTTLAFPFIFGAMQDAARVWNGYGFWFRFFSALPVITRNLLLVGLTWWCWRETAQAAPAESIPIAATPPARAAKRTRARR